MSNTRGRADREERLDALLAEAMTEAWSAADTDAILVAIERDGRRRARGRRVALALATAAGIAGLLMDPSARGGLFAGLEGAVATGGDGLASLADGAPSVGLTAGLSGPLAIGIAVLAAIANLWLWRRSTAAAVNR